LCVPGVGDVLMNHLRKHLGMRWRCDLDGCGRVLSDRKSALDHIVGVHRIPRSLGVGHIVCVNVLFMKGLFVCLVLVLLLVGSHAVLMVVKWCVVIC